MEKMYLVIQDWSVGNEVEMASYLLFRKYEDAKEYLEKIKEFEETDAEEQEELRRLDKMIAQIDYYIRGLEDAKKYIEEVE